MKVRIWCCTHDPQSKEEEIIDLEEYGLSKKDIEDIEAGDTETLGSLSCLQNEMRG